MGAYLSQPNTVKCSGDGVGAPRLPLPYGFSAMQGWRVSMEVRRLGPQPGHCTAGTCRRKGAGDGVLPGEGSQPTACGRRGTLGSNSERGVGVEGAAGARQPRAGGQWRRELGHVGRGTFRPLSALSVPSRHPLVPARPSRLLSGVRVSVGMKTERGSMYSLVFPGRAE